MPIRVARRPAGLTLHPSRLALCAVAATIACLGLPAQAWGATVPGSTSDSLPDGAAIDRYVQSEMAAQRIPGLALSIVHAGLVVHARGFGEANSTGQRVTPGRRSSSAR
jgi:CubicO group peptidase (beta-lactamase class C family)